MANGVDLVWAVFKVSAHPKSRRPVGGNKLSREKGHACHVPTCRYSELPSEGEERRAEKSRGEKGTTNIFFYFSLSLHVLFSTQTLSFLQAHVVTLIHFSFPRIEFSGTHTAASTSLPASSCSISSLCPPSVLVYALPPSVPALNLSLHILPRLPQQRLLGLSYLLAELHWHYWWNSVTTEHLLAAVLLAQGHRFGQAKYLTACSPSLFSFLIVNRRLTQAMETCFCTTSALTAYSE